jgi:membrane-associated protein
VLDFIYWLNPEHLLASLIHWLPTVPTWSLVAILFSIVFAESGLFFGFFLPGDSLLFSAGLLVAQDRLAIGLAELLVLLFLAAVAGDSVGYLFGQTFGRQFFSKPGSLLRDPHHLQKAEAFYAKHGRKTIILARFVPVVRTFAPVAAGISSMNYRTFVLFNVIGAFIWSFGVTLAGFWLGQIIPNVDQYLLPIIGLIIVVSVIQPAWHLWQDKKQSQRAMPSKEG